MTLDQLDLDLNSRRVPGFDEVDRESAKTRRKKVWALMSDGKWHTTMEICDAGVGGAEGCRRLRELRAECRAGLRFGVSGIEKRRTPGDSQQWQYRLIPSTPDSK